MSNNYLLPALLLVTPSLVFANNLQEEWKDENQDSPWSGYVSADYSRNGYKDSASNANRSASATGVVRYSFTDKSRLQLVVSGYHQQDGDVYGTQGQFWNDTSISYARNGLFKPTEGSSISGEVRMILPTSKASRRNDLKLGTRLKLHWSAPFDNWLDGLTLSNTLLLRKNFHEYKTAGGYQLIEYRLSNQFSIDYAFADDFYFNMYVMPRQSWDYNGNTFDPNVMHGEEIGYQVTDDISLAVGMTNGISYYDPERGSSPINDLIDLKKTTYYALISYQF
ncbi:hypothetical protein VISI1226_11097 [Vibrio sinaloensis DSM 21326]|uniref:Outer membrane receptor protein n=1 Tax=Vibrio sinaloensis DSM 21326 TaxID=945550 RepID=E8MB41_PHOS4|nr:hypothetical protein [Vibrio sinaloensis]EGA68871.1 hypothetical protein VISI1226_11097 [Vibrio sinaloensis DSM 21326]